jgi:hypothetical protein
MKCGLTALALAVAFGGAAIAAPHKARILRNRSVAEAQGPSFDGSWIFEVATTVGSCPEKVVNTVSISENRVAAVDESGVSPWGYVDGDGTFVARFTGKNGRVARMHGQLRGYAGSGAWSSSTDMCGGAWRAHRDGAEHAGR